MRVQDHLKADLERDPNFRELRPWNKHRHTADASLYPCLSVWHLITEHRGFKKASGGTIAKGAF